MASPGFYFCSRISIVADPRGKSATTLGGPNTGMLEKGPVRGVRQSIYNYLNSIYMANTPPVGLYTAGRFCQLYQIGPFRKRDNTSTLESILAYAQAGVKRRADIDGLLQQSANIPRASGIVPDG